MHRFERYLDFLGILTQRFIVQSRAKAVDFLKILRNKLKINEGASRVISSKLTLQKSKNYTNQFFEIRKKPDSLSALRKLANESIEASSST